MQPPVYQKYFGLSAMPFDLHEPRFSAASFFNRNISMCSINEDVPVPVPPPFRNPAALNSSILENIFAQTNSRHRISMDYSGFLHKQPPS